MGCGGETAASRDNRQRIYKHTASIYPADARRQHRKMLGQNPAGSSGVAHRESRFTTGKHFFSPLSPARSTPRLRPGLPPSETRAIPSHEGASVMPTGKQILATAAAFRKRPSLTAHSPTPGPASRTPAASEAAGQRALEQEILLTQFAEAEGAQYVAPEWLRFANSGNALCRSPPVASQSRQTPPNRAPPQPDPAGSVECGAACCQKPQKCRADFPIRY